MKRLILATILAVSALVSTGGSAQAQNSHPHFPPFGCGGYCIGFLSRLHFHGPLYNYGPYSGYYPFEPYGPWTANLQYNPPPMSCGKNGENCGERGGWGHYALSTLKNVFHRTNQCGNRRCGGGLNLGLLGHHGKSCSSCGGSSCGTGGCPTAATSVEPAPVAGNPPATAPAAPPAQKK